MSLLNLIWEKKMSLFNLICRSKIKWYCVGCEYYTECLKELIKKDGEK